MMREPKIQFPVVLGMTWLFSLCSVAPASAADIGSTSVTNPYITIDPIGNHTICDVFFINGTTNLPVGDILRIETLESPVKHQIFEWHLETNTSVQQGKSGVNIWSCNISPMLWKTYGASHDIRQFETGQRYIAVYPEDSFPAQFAYIESNEFTIFPVASGPAQDVSQTGIVKGTTTVPPSPALTVVSKTSSPATTAVSLSGILPVLAITTMAVVWSIYLRRQV